MKDCSSEKPCYYCKETKKHASALCPKKFGYQERKSEKPSTANTDANTTSAVQKKSEDKTSVNLSRMEKGTYLTSSRKMQHEN